MAKNINRQSIVKEMVELVKALGGYAKIYTRKGFANDADMNGTIYIEIEEDWNGNPTNRLNIVAEYFGGDEDYLFISELRTRYLITMRNALFSLYGKKVFRKK